MNFRRIPILLSDETGLVKPDRFGPRQYIGDVLNAAKVFSAFRADELAIINITKDSGTKPIDQDLLGKVAKWFEGPLSYGGGINTLERASTVFKLGYEKIILNRCLRDNSNLATQISKQYGSQAITANIDVTFSGDDWYVFEHERRSASNSKVVDFLTALDATPCGEILINVIESEKQNGLVAFDLAGKLRKLTHKPIIFSSGVRTLDECQKLQTLKIDAVGVGSWSAFHAKSNAVLLNYPENLPW